MRSSTVCKSSNVDLLDLLLTVREIDKSLEIGISGILKSWMSSSSEDSLSLDSSSRGHVRVFLIVFYLEISSLRVLMVKSGLLVLKLSGGGFNGSVL